jgi:hypothetical protein
MIVLVILCWLLILGSLSGKTWEKEQYLPNTLVFITSLLILFLYYGGFTK